MPADELEQALLAQRVSNAERDEVEVIARALEIPQTVLHRVIYAIQMFGHGIPRVDWDATLSKELRNAIQKAMEDGWHRMTIGNAIRSGKTLHVWAKNLVPENQKRKICHGCPERMQCVAEKLSTPEECYATKKAHLEVTPLRMTATHLEVEAKQPIGRHSILLSLIVMKETP